MPLKFYDFIHSELQTTKSKQQYLGYAVNVRDNQHEVLQFIGNAFGVKIGKEGVIIESLWDDTVAPLKLTLLEFIEKLSAFEY